VTRAVRALLTVARLTWAVVAFLTTLTRAVLGALLAALFGWRYGAR